MSEELRAALDALDSEAEEWYQTARTLLDGVAKANSLSITPNSFSFIDEFTGVSAAYDSAHSFVLNVLNNGATETTNIGDTLTKTRKDYESTDQAVAAEAKKVWILE